VSDIFEGLQFAVFHAETEMNLLDDPFLLGTAGPERMTIRAPLPGDGFLNITALDGLENASTGPIQFDHNKVAPVSLHPPSLNAHCEPDSRCHFQITLTNNHSSSIELYPFFNSDSVEITPASMILEPEASGVFEIALSAGTELNQELSQYIIINAGDEFYPIKYNILLKVAEPTDMASDNPIIPGHFNVSPAYPNPFNGLVTFDIDRSQNRPVDVDIYNIAGRKVAAYHIPPGQQSKFAWPGIDNEGFTASSGLYFFRFSTDNFSVIRKALFLK